MNKRKSINDIARELHVAISTVSAVLNGKAEERRISTAMKEKVLAYAEKCGYQPNMVARSLRTGKSKILGMLVEDIADPFFATIARLVEKNAALHDYKLFYSSTENNTTIAKSLIRAFRDRQVDGFIIAPSPGIEKEIQSLLTDQIPLVLFDRYFPNIETNRVVVDNFAGAFNATKHFIQQGFQNIAFITLSSQQTQMTDRLSGYKEALHQHLLQDCIYEISYTLSDEILLKQILFFVKNNPQIDAILFGTNYLAINGLKAIDKLGQKVPDDIAVIGFDDNTHFGLFSPSITAVAQPITDIATHIVKLLMIDLKNSHVEHDKKAVTLDTHLIIRQSSYERVKNRP